MAKGGNAFVKVVIAGGGIGGVTAALALARRSFDVEIVEQASALREAGAGLQLSPNAMKVFRALGIEERIASVASVPKALELRLGRSGQKVFSIPMGGAASRRYGAPYLHIHRADLLEILLGAAKESGQVRVRLGARLAGYLEEGRGVRAGLDTGEIVEGDVLVGADGLHSQVRRQLCGPDEAQFTGAVAWRFTAPADAVREHFDAPAATVWAGPGRHAVTYALRRGELMNFVGVVESDGWRAEGWSEEGDLTELAAAFAGWARPVTALIEAATSCMRWALFDRDLLERWTAGRVALLGDACHPMPPFQAQGAAMAAEDAFVLARCLGDAGGNIPGALAHYERLRKPRTTKVLASARSNMGVFHRSNPVTQAATYGPMKLAGMLLPGFVRSRQDWIYGHDATRA
ncbi:MAG: FAD-dependent monooxygenase [Alphaproteobacteria bacterium]|nr:FAD-dependent monooxygenase [Alphaproteobacteria bacterium]